MILEEKILEILKEGKPLKGREIASLLASRHGLNVDKTEVNSTLYRKLRDKAIQNKQYQWSLKNVTSEKKIDKQPVNKSTPLSKLAFYYLECLSKDMNGGISEFASSKYSLRYTQLNSFPVDGAPMQQIDRHLIDKVKKDKNNFVFKLGYPILIKSIRGKDGNPYIFAEPLFIFSLDLDSALQTANVSLGEDDLTVNAKALESITGINSSTELLLEAVQLCDELGLNNDPEDKPAYEDLFMRFVELRSEWPWKENINFKMLSAGPLSAVAAQGIYNKAAVFVTEKSKFTAGLEKDLKDLSQMSESEYSNSALGAWIENSIRETLVSDKVIIEPIPLNEEQREAVLKGLSSPLTVVTGPPGTGKSQVVANLIANAVYQGQTVLFSSKNNKAVDVVNERVNALSNRPVMLRLGSKFQATLAEYLSSLLSARPSNDDQSRYNEAKSIHEDLLSKIENIKKQQEELITLRNKVDQLEVSVENYREELGGDLFASCQDFKESDFAELNLLLESGKEKLKYSDRKQQAIFFSLFWTFFKDKRFAKTQDNFDRSRQKFMLLGVNQPAIGVDDTSIEVYNQYLANLFERCKKAKAINEYFRHLKTLSERQDLFQLALKEKALTDEVVGNSLELWSCWLQLMPTRMSQHDRRIIGDYIAVLNLIVAAENTKQTLDKGVWARYYSFLPQITHILSCWAVTSLSAKGRVPLKQGFFDLVVIDEASQCDIASALPLLFRAKRAVIIGDDKQLTHISSITEAQDIQLLEKHCLDDEFMGWSYAANSLFRLASSRSRAENIVVLRDHHRSHGDIINYSNRNFYENTLRVATKYENLKSIPGEPAVRWIDVKGKCVRPESGSTYNDKEAEAVVKELSRLVANGYKGTIGVVTPFRAQYIRILDKINQNKDLFDRLMIRDFLCDTVHKFQGDERDVMIFSSVVSESVTHGAVSFLKRTGNLFNVAITRARASLIVVGDNQMSYKSGIPHYKGFVEYVNELKESTANNAPDLLETDFGPKYPKLNKSVIISDWEKYLYEQLYRIGIKTVPQYQVGQYSLDLALFSGDRKLNIEIDGEKYHRNWDGELMKRDQLRNKRLIELGWDVQRFWVYEIRDNLKTCVQRIEKWKE
jgi:very-short-patch-repair endonuclease